MYRLLVVATLLFLLLTTPILTQAMDSTSPTNCSYRVYYIKMYSVDKALDVSIKAISTLEGSPRNYTYRVAVDYGELVSINDRVFVNTSLGYIIYFYTNNSKKPVYIVSVYPTHFTIYNMSALTRLREYTWSDSEAVEHGREVIALLLRLNGLERNITIVYNGSRVSASIKHSGREIILLKRYNYVLSLDNVVDNRAFIEYTGCEEIALVHIPYIHVSSNCYSVASSDPEYVLASGLRHVGREYKRLLYNLLQNSSVWFMGRYYREYYGGDNTIVYTLAYIYKVEKSSPWRGSRTWYLDIIYYRGGYDIVSIYNKTVLLNTSTSIHIDLDRVFKIISLGGARQVSIEVFYGLITVSIVLFIVIESSKRLRE